MNAIAEMTDDKCTYRHIVDAQILPALLGQAPVFWPRFGKLRLDSSPCKEPHHIERHDNAVEIAHITQGTARVYFERDWCIAHMGDTFILPSAIQHDFVTDVSADYNAFWLSCHDDTHVLHCQNRREPALHNRPHLFLPASTPSRGTLHNLLERIQYDSAYIELTMWSLIVQFMVDILDILTPSPSPADIMIKNEISLTHRLAIQNILYILKRDMREDINLELLAQHVGFTKNYLCTLFTEATGENIFSCLRRLRMQRAKELLLRSNAPVQEIAKAVGYHNMSSFSRAFQEAYRTSPSRLRCSGEFSSAHHQLSSTTFTSIP